MRSGLGNLNAFMRISVHSLRGTDARKTHAPKFKFTLSHFPRNTLANTMSYSETYELALGYASMGFRMNLKISSTVPIHLTDGIGILIAVTNIYLGIAVACTKVGTVPEFSSCFWR